jgi:hypothetical protein
MDVLIGLFERNLCALSILAFKLFNPFEVSWSFVLTNLQKRNADILSIHEISASSVESNLWL